MFVKKILSMVMLLLIGAPIFTPLVVNGKDLTGVDNEARNVCSNITADNYNEPQCMDIPVDLVNPGFETPQTSGSYGAELSDDLVPGWSSTDEHGGKNLIDIEKKGSFYNCSEGSQCAGINTYQSASIYQDFDVQPGQKLYYSFDHIGANRGPDQTVGLKIGKPLLPEDIVDPKNPTAGGEKDLLVKDVVDYYTNSEVSGTYIVPEDMTKARMAFSTYSTLGYGNAVDDVKITTKAVYDNILKIEDSNGVNDGIGQDVFTVNNQLTHLQGDLQDDSVLTYTFNQPVIVEGGTINVDGEDYPLDESNMTANGSTVEITNIPEVSVGKNAENIEVNMNVKPESSIDDVLDLSVKSNFEFYSEIEKEIDSEASSYTVEEGTKIEVNYGSTGSGNTNTENITNISYGCNQEECNNSTDYAGVSTDNSFLQHVDYKINANTHEVIVQIVTKTPLAEDDTLTMTVQDEFGGATEIDEKDPTFRDLGNNTYSISTGSLIGVLADEGKYTVKFVKNGQSVTIPADSDGNGEINTDDSNVDNFEIKVPTIVKNEDINYAAIGDTENEETDITNVSVAEKTTPDNVENYGVYELESIAYEKANGISSSTIWDPETDLTLIKYDHVIRSENSDYLLAKNIDAASSQSNKDADIEGGFGEDGFRPIGQKVSTPTGSDATIFTGNISGDVDTIVGASEENTYIANLYINEPNYNYVGLIARAMGVKIDNIGIIDPKIIGKSFVGGFVGYMQASEDDLGLLNVYVLETQEDSQETPNYDITGTDQVGGLIGHASDVSISSDSRFEGEVPGIDLSADEQPSNLPDKDGYKTFSTVDVTSGGVAGGIVGNLDAGDVEFVYTKSNVDGGEYVGGIAGVFGGSIMNAYNSTISTENTIVGDSSVGGIVGAIAQGGQLKNTYNQANILGDGQNAKGISSIGGITGSLPSGQILYSYNLGNVTSTGDDSTSYAGGIVGEHPLTSTTQINTVYNAGNISADQAGGITGGKNLETGSDNSISISNAVNFGDDENGNGIIGGTKTNQAHINNCYVWDQALVGLEDDTLSVSTKEAQDPDWWTTEATFSTSWNINDGDGIVPDPDSDSTDESIDDDLGIVKSNAIYLPTLLEFSGQSEIPEQKGKEISDKFKSKSMEGFEITNFKIDADTLDISILLNNLGVENSDYRGKGTIEIEDMSNKKIISVNNIELSNENKQIEVPIINEGNVIKEDTTYRVKFIEDGQEKNSIRIHTPKQTVDNQVVYSMIGDLVNDETDIDKTIDTTLNEKNLGVKELESIGYEEVSEFNAMDGKLEQEEWTGNDLTINKYDHVIRDLNANYLVADNIDAASSQTNKDADIDGGFGEDGFRPIGQKVKTQSGDDSLPFTGSITGDVDTLLGAESNNTFISNIYIDEPNLNNVGMIANTLDGNIDNLGIVDPSITGQKNVGSFVGYMKGTNEKESYLLNTYVLESVSDSQESPNYDVQSLQGNVGGIVGEVENSSILSNSRFNGIVPGIDLSQEKLNSNGYKTFSTIDVSGQGDNVGAVAGLQIDGDLNSLYTKSNVQGMNYTGGIVGHSLSGNIQNVYNNADTDSYTIQGSENTGGIVGSLEGGSINNTYNESNIKSLTNSNNVGGIVGSMGEGSEKSNIENTYNNGNIDATLSETYVGGIAGHIDTGANVIKNVYNTGYVSSEADFVSGIAGGIADDSATGDIKFVNIINLGNIQGSRDYTDAILGSLNISDIIAENIYTFNGAKINSTADDNYSQVNQDDIVNPLWWRTTLNFDNNWNIEAGDASIPNHIDDEEDENSDDNLGMVVNNSVHMPTLIENTTITLEIPEQNIEDKNIKVNSDTVNKNSTTQELSNEVLMDENNAVDKNLEGVRETVDISQIILDKDALLDFLNTDETFRNSLKDADQEKIKEISEKYDKIDEVVQEKLVSFENYLEEKGKTYVKENKKQIFNILNLIDVVNMQILRVDYNLTNEETEVLYSLLIDGNYDDLVIKKENIVELSSDKLDEFKIFLEDFAYNLLKNENYYKENKQEINDTLDSFFYE